MEGLNALAGMILLFVPAVLAVGAALTLLEPLIKSIGWFLRVAQGHDTAEDWAARRNKKNNP